MIYVCCLLYYIVIRIHIWRYLSTASNDNNHTRMERDGVVEHGDI